MSEEIKELIDTLEDCLKNPNLLDRAKAQRFYNGVSNLQQKVEQLEKENKRLNNIINELEEYLNQEIIEWQDVSDLWTKAQVQEDRIVLDKLKELKEGKNE